MGQLRQPMGQLRQPMGQLRQPMGQLRQHCDPFACSATDSMKASLYRQNIVATQSVKEIELQRFFSSMIYLIRYSADRA